MKHLKKIFSDLLIKFPLESVLADIVCIIFYQFLILKIIDLLIKNLLIGLIIAVPFQMLALFSAALISFKKDENSKNNWYNKIGSKLWWGAVFFIIFFGVAWLISVLRALEVVLNIGIKTRNSKNYSDVVYLGIYLLSFLSSWLSFSPAYKLSLSKNLENNILTRFFTAFAVMLFLIFFSSIFTASLTILKTEIPSVQYYALVGAGAFLFLPIRIILLLRPPFNFMEIVSFLTAFIFFMINIFRV